MLVTIALMALLNAGPVCDRLCDPDPMCQAVCGTPDRKEQQAICEARLMSTAKDLKELETLTDACFTALDRCQAKKACPLPKKPVKKPVKKIGKKAVVVVAPAPASQHQNQDQQQANQQQQSQQVIINVNQPEARLVREDRQSAPFPLGIGVRGAVGLTCSPAAFALVGLRARLLPAHLGLEVNTQFNWGHSAQLMVYPIQGPISWHLDFGGLMYMNKGAKFNLLAGTGVEVQIVPHFSITADWRMTMAKPFYLGDSLLKSQLMLGLMLHTW